MIQITPQMKILVAVEAVDGRKGIDSLVRLCLEKPRQIRSLDACLSFAAGKQRRSACWCTTTGILVGPQAAQKDGLSGG